jgi:hypothetical protein
VEGDANVIRGDREDRRRGSRGIETPPRNLSWALGALHADDIRVCIGRVASSLARSRDAQ